MGVRLADAIVAIHHHLDDAQLPHAFGGAIALAFCTGEPRATKDVDVNVFVGERRADEVLEAMPTGVRITEANRTAIARDGQTRLWWDEVPIDVFLSNHWFHGAVETRVRTVPFRDSPDLPVLSCEDLGVFKTFFARPKDAIDVANMVAIGSVTVEHLQSTVDRLFGVEARADFLATVRRFSEEIAGDDSDGFRSLPSS